MDDAWHQRKRWVTSIQLFRRCNSEISLGRRFACGSTLSLGIIGMCVIIFSLSINVLQLIFSFLRDTGEQRLHLPWKVSIITLFSWRCTYINDLQSQNSQLGLNPNLFTLATKLYRTPCIFASFAIRLPFSHLYSCIPCSFVGLSTVHVVNVDSEFIWAMIFFFEPYLESVKEWKISKMSQAVFHIDIVWYSVAGRPCNVILWTTNNFIVSKVFLSSECYLWRTFFLWLRMFLYPWKSMLCPQHFLLFRERRS